MYVCYRDGCCGSPGKGVRSIGKSGQRLKASSGREWGAIGEPDVQSGWREYTVGAKKLRKFVGVATRALSTKGRSLEFVQSHCSFQLWRHLVRAVI